MCDTCGCESGDDRITVMKSGQSGHSHPHADHVHSHDHGHDHGHNHDHEHDHEHESGRDHDPSYPAGRIISVETDVLQKNNLLAQRNRGYFEAKGILALNLVSSPGSGKTTVLERTLNTLKKEKELFVIEGDQQTTLDASRIIATGIPVVQINTGSGCHLDAGMINRAVKELNPSDHSLLMIENVGNLVCPALFDLGENFRVVIISITEGEDKPLKYPQMFMSSQVCLINKTDLLPYVEFSVEKLKEYIRRVNPRLECIELSARTGEGFETWMDWIRKRILS